jgi:hypothetical protein
MNYILAVDDGFSIHGRIFVCRTALASILYYLQCTYYCQLYSEDSLQFTVTCQLATHLTFFKMFVSIVEIHLDSQH